MCGWQMASVRVFAVERWRSRRTVPAWAWTFLSLRGETPQEDQLGLMRLRLVSRSVNKYALW